MFDEEATFRIDHYLGKETVQNLLALRFGNQLFHPMWNNTFISSVQITVAEEIGVAGRGSYYADTGALRDMVQITCCKSCHWWRWNLPPVSRRPIFAMKK